MDFFTENHGLLLEKYANAYASWKYSYTGIKELIYPILQERIDF